MRWLSRVPQPSGGWASPLPFLQMTEEEYRALLKERGYGARYIQEELRQLREARRRHNLPGRPEVEEAKAAGDSIFDRLAERRKRRREYTDKQEEQ